MSINSKKNRLAFSQGGFSSFSGGEMVYVGRPNSPHVSAVSGFAADAGLTFSMVDWGSDSRFTARRLLPASIVAIHNGLLHCTPQAKLFCEIHDIPHFFIENGMLPQSENAFVDPKGFCSSSVLCGNLDWISDDDMQNLALKRADLQQKYPLKNNGRVLVACQVNSDSSVLYHSRFTQMQQLVDRVISDFPGREIVVRTHPKGERHLHLPPEKATWQNPLGSDFLAEAARSDVVVAITSTCLFEAAVLGVKVKSYGNCAFTAHSDADHERVAAGALALNVPLRGGDVWPVLARFGVRPLDKEEVKTV